jgi:hypothetical protein
LTKRPSKPVVFIEEHVHSSEAGPGAPVACKPLAWFMHLTQGEHHLEIGRALNHELQKHGFAGERAFPPVRAGRLHRRRKLP